MKHTHTQNLIPFLTMSSNLNVYFHFMISQVIPHAFQFQKQHQSNFFVVVTYIMCLKICFSQLRSKYNTERYRCQLKQKTNKNLSVFLRFYAYSFLSLPYLFFLCPHTLWARRDHKSTTKTYMFEQSSPKKKNNEKL